MRLNRIQIEGEWVDELAELAGFWDLVKLQELPKTAAVGDIVLDDKVVVTGIPISALLFLEKQLAHLSTLIGNLPSIAKMRDAAKVALKQANERQKIGTALLDD